MLKTKMVDIKINKGMGKLNLNFKSDFSLPDYEEIFSFLKIYAKGQMFEKIEIDFGGVFFEITDLMEKLIEKSYLLRSKQTQFVLTIGKYDLSHRIECLRCLRNLKVKNYKITYFKK